MPSEGLQSVREGIVNSAMIIFLLGGPVLLAFSLSRARTEGWQWIMNVHVAAFALMLLVVLLRKKLGYEIQTLIIVVLLFLIGCGNLLAWGLMSTFGLFCMASALFATVFAGVRSGVFVLMGSLLFMAGTGFAHRLGWLSFAAATGGRMSAPAFWESYAATIMFLTWGCVAVVSSMFRAMRGVLCQLADRASEAEAGRDRFEGIFMSSPEAMVISDAATARITQVNGGFTTFLGYTEKESVGKTAFDLDLWHDAADRQRVLEHLTACGPVNNRRVRFRTRSGEVVTGMLSARHISLDDAPRLLFMARDITALVHAEEELLANQEKLRSLANRLTVAEEQERRRVARELHDRVIQHMALAKIKVEGFFENTDRQGSEEPKAEILALLDKVIEDARSLLFEISPPVINLLGFGEALRWLADRFTSASKIPCDVRLEEMEGFLEEEVQITLFHAARELLNNVAKYSGARRSELSLIRNNGQAVLQVIDDGKGFDPETVGICTDTLRGFGLFSIRERVHFFGGDFTIDSSPGQGSRLRVIVPVTVQRESGDVP